jgi:hypothetical protein
MKSSKIESECRRLALAWIEAEQHYREVRCRTKNRQLRQQAAKTAKQRYSEFHKFFTS